MDSILKKIVDSTKVRLLKDMQKIPQEKLKINPFKREPFLFEKALKKQDITFICEVKKASPSKGIIAHDFDYLSIAKDYEKAGADAISVLTEPDYFLGSDEYLKNIRKVVDIPIIRKDFIIDEYQIYQASSLGADAVLLICAILDTATIKKYIKIADTLGLSCLVEAHNQDEINSALNANARIIGINNRNLHDFNTSVNTSISLKNSINNNAITVSESGISRSQDIENIRKAGFNAVLIGETLMKSENKKLMLDTLKGIV